MFMKYNLFVIICIFLSLLSSCNTHNTTEERLKKLEQENKELKEKISTEQPNRSNSTNYQNTSPNYNTSTNTKYVFVLLKTTQIERDEMTMDKIEKRYNYCSEIQNLPFISEDIKYELMDKVQRSYKNSASAIVYNGRVNSRQVFVFDSYEEASKAREKYLVGR